MSEFPKGVGLFRADQLKTPCIFILEYIGIHKTYLRKYISLYIGAYWNTYILSDKAIYRYIIDILMLRQSDSMSYLNQLI